MTYMARVREHLAERRERGLPFERAWREAMEACPPPEGWGLDGFVRPKPAHRSEVAPLMFARRMFEKAYNGQPLPGPDMRAVCAIFEEGVDERPVSAHVPYVGPREAA